ncbi:Mucin-associated surface protein (MASP) [Trypanosoma cruzi]|uniref:Mucin-associated surface protein (MASP), putative n=2 Tax=Trypanosoma cruzi TaxID=5693 RepID=Q4CPX9_TRYCC|nr:mucin-associated surface protein (MASP), putative [Trypanosoma cruzi]EAN82330.1 mucin-associated surface protein (MASP), putative [Trypanosoma cruzi]PWV17807.1 Mucin-associated surface protein (MASP) [Trypanosoma cruzi]RNC34087.1 mucin-associated surface protein (MASP) [Trypanosoma cruzi]|eukprot:XP_804181.1 mucin-associated surface protein (MASP) [Trypanosoma cruzi strain CL Brener]
MMMMAGRVLLVCALCVLWCGAGCCAEESAGGVLPGASGGGAGSLQGSQPIVPEALKNSDLKASDINDKTEETPIKVPLAEQEEISDDDDEGEDEEEGPSPPTPTKGGGGVQPQANNGKLKKENESELQTENQRHVEVERQNPSEKETVDAGEAGVNQQNEGSRLKPQHQKIPVQEEDTRNVEGNQPTQEKEQQTNVEEITPHNPAGDHSPGEHKGNDGSNEGEEKDGEEGVEDHEGHRDQVREEAAHVSGAPKVNSADIQQEVQRTHAGGTLTGIKQKTGEEKDDETEEEREQQKEQNQENPPGKEQKTKTGANTTNQINTTPADSDSSTAVSHTTTSPLLLLFVACAAAAAVVAA